MKTTPQLFCVAEDWMLLEGGILYGFTRTKIVAKINLYCKSTQHDFGNCRAGCFVCILFLAYFIEFDILRKTRLDVNVLFSF